MLGETYLTIASANNRGFLFSSSGPKGNIVKAVIFQQGDEPGRYNLAFGDVVNGDIDDEVVSNNEDFVKVLATVAKCVYRFVKYYPAAVIDVVPVDEKRKILYNTIFKRHWKTIEKKFEIKGYKTEKSYRYNAADSYDRFELLHKS